MHIIIIIIEIFVWIFYPRFHLWNRVKITSCFLTVWILHHHIAPLFICLFIFKHAEVCRRNKHELKVWSVSSELEVHRWIGQGWTSPPDTHRIFRGKKEERWRRGEREVCWAFWLNVNVSELNMASGGRGTAGGLGVCRLGVSSAVWHFVTNCQKIYESWT